MKPDAILCFILLVCLLSLGCQGKTEQRVRPPKNGGIYVIAHRGAHIGIPENTLAAYQKAIDIGADFVEIDLRTTRDSGFVSIHNRTVDAYVDGVTGEVANFTLAELRALDIGARIGPEWQGTRIPTFDEILDLCKGRIGIYLDLKQGPIPPLVEMVKRRGMERDVLWLVDEDELLLVQELCEECIIMPDPGDEEILARILAQFEPAVVAPVWNDFSPTYAAPCHEAGTLVFVDEDDPGSWSNALLWQADGIQTDHPEQLIEFLLKRKRAEN